MILDGEMLIFYFEFVLIFMLTADLNGYSAETMSKRSMPIQPVVTVPEERVAYSEYSQSARRQGASNFQL